ncbi:MAG: PDZ domain-containing protein, partial [Clostridia bacterium]|nr:PDZ domain-containing protein [Clostridia bacterium]
MDNFEGMGFAIPVNDVVRICTDIIKNGNVKAAYLGIELNTQYSATYLEQLAYPGGLLVKSVISGSPADKAGLEADDIIVSFNGSEVRTADELATLKNKCSSGDKVVIRI